MPFYVAVDHDRQAVVVSIRGSLSMEVRKYNTIVLFAEREREEVQKNRQRPLLVETV